MQAAADVRRFRLKPIWPSLLALAEAEQTCKCLQHRLVSPSHNDKELNLPAFQSARSPAFAREGTEERLAGPKTLLIISIVFGGRTSRLIQSCIAIFRQINVAIICFEPSTVTAKHRLRLADFWWQIWMKHSKKKKKKRLPKPSTWTRTRVASSVRRRSRKTCLCAFRCPHSSSQDAHERENASQALMRRPGLRGRQGTAALHDSRGPFEEWAPTTAAPATSSTSDMTPSQTALPPQSVLLLTEGQERIKKKKNKALKQRLEPNTRINHTNRHTHAQRNFHYLPSCFEVELFNMVRNSGQLIHGDNKRRDDKRSDERFLRKHLPHLTTYHSLTSSPNSGSGAATLIVFNVTGRKQPHVGWRFCWVPLNSLIQFLNKHSQDVSQDKHGG